MANQEPLIPGLRPVTAPDDTRQPKELSDKEIKKIVRFPGERVPVAEAADALLDIQRWCQFLAERNRNDDLIGLENFDIAVIKTTNDGRNPQFADAGLALVFRSANTGNSASVDAYPPRGFESPTYHLSTANLLVQLGSTPQK